MKQILSFCLVILFILIFPLSFLQLPDKIILNMKSELRALIKDNHLLTEKPEKAKNMNVGKIKMGMTQSQVNRILGEPHEQLLNEYQQYWTVYHRDYDDFMLVMYLNGKVSGVYSNQNMVVTEKGLKYGLTRENVEKKLGQPLEVFQGKDYQLALDNKESAIYQDGQYFVTIYYDKYRNNTVSGIKIINKSIDQLKKNYYAYPNDNLEKDYARLHFELTNSTRKMFGKQILNVYPEIAKVANTHAKDMAEHHYFSHTNKQNETPFDRIKKANLNYSVAGENIAYGQVSPIEAHHGLMNSIGHRKNILKQDYMNLGVGVAFNDNNQPFYVENYITQYK